MSFVFSRQRLHALASRLVGRTEQPSVGTPVEPALPHNEAQLVAYAAKARAQGFDRLVLYLTFDCDTDEDAAAALQLDPWLRSRGIRAAYAVPGAQLERAADSYLWLKQAGAAFLNHGYQPHAQWQEDRYVPVTFYEQMSATEVEADIRRGHETATAVIGEAPRGFRAPHFGSFQSPEQLALIYRVARNLGYLYCSTTIPQVALDHGPMVARNGVFELPLFGSHLAPTTILDSWTYLEDRKTFRLGQAYFELFRDTVDYMQTKDLSGVLAYYVDPAHVIGQQPFLDAMELIAERGIASVTAEEIVIKAHGQLRAGSTVKRN
jgi:peptidoglycan/xylan/chitin deacetylase (PgdA/CDA1 family)